MKKVLFLSGRELQYPRNQVFFNSICQSFQTIRPLSGNESISKGGAIQIILRSLRQSLDVILKNYIHLSDIIFVGFYGQLLAILFRQLTKKPLVFDFFISTYEALVEDRKKLKPDSFFAKLAFKIDKAAAKNANLIFVDTSQQKNNLSARFNIELNKIIPVYVGCDENIFHPKLGKPEPGLILFYCSFLPLHGVDVILEAAAILNNQHGVHFQIIGDGPEKKRAEKILQQMGDIGLRFESPVSLEILAERIAKAEICLGGHFGTSLKAENVIPGKVFQMMAMGKPIIAGDTAANREVLTNFESALLVKPGDPNALAQAISSLIGNPELREYLAKNALQRYHQIASCDVIAQVINSAFKDHLLF